MNDNNISIINKYRLPLMGFAALWIFLSHEQAHEWVRIYYPPLILCRSIDFAKSIGYCGVDIFLLLSGVGLVYAREKHSLFTFYARRLERVFIPYLIVAILFAFLEKWTLEIFFKKIFFFEFLFQNMYGFLWFIPAVLILYFCFPLYYNFFKKSKNKIVFTVFAIIIWLSLSLLMKNTMRTELYGFTNRIPIFLTGIFLGWQIRETDYKITNRAWLSLIITFIVGIILIYLTGPQNVYFIVPVSNSCVPTYLLALSGTFLAAKVFSIVSTWSLGALFIKFFAFLGTISLEIYCIQERLDDILRPLLIISYEQWAKNFVWINLVIAVAVITASTLLYYLSRYIGRILFHGKKAKKLEAK